MLDRTVLPGYSRIGYDVRRRGWARDDPASGSLRGKVAVVTGAGSGLGQATATALAELGAQVHLVVRTPKKGRAAVAAIEAEVPGAEVVLHRCDVSDQASVRAFSAALRRSVEHVDVLVHNAGVMPAERQVTVDGHEVALATHVLGPVLMTELLRPVLAAADGARVIVVSSGGMYAQKLPVEDPEFSQGSTAGRRPTLAPSGCRSRWVHSCRSGGPPTGSPCTPFTPAGPTRRACSARCPGSTR